MLPNHGFTATKDEAKAAFAETWRRWLKQRKQPDVAVLFMPVVVTVTRAD